jgi:hypothetical protein
MLIVSFHKISLTMCLQRIGTFHVVKSVSITPYQTKRTILLIPRNLLQVKIVWLSRDVLICEWSRVLVPARSFITLIEAILYTESL